MVPLGLLCNDWGLGETRCSVGEGESVACLTGGPAVIIPLVRVVTVLPYPGGRLRVGIYTLKIFCEEQQDFWTFLVHVRKAAAKRSVQRNLN